MAYSLDFQLKFLIKNEKENEEIVEMVEHKEMPLPAYTRLDLHPEGNLTDAQCPTLINWAKAQMDTLQAHYPADSLVLRRPHTESSIQRPLPIVAGQREYSLSRFRVSGTSHHDLAIGLQCHGPSFAVAGTDRRSLPSTPKSVSSEPSEW